MIRKYIFPLLSVWIIVAYLHLLHCLFVLEVVTSLRVILFLFIPVIFLETIFSLLFCGQGLRDIIKTAFWQKVAIAGRVLTWLIFFGLWAIGMGYLSKIGDPSQDANYQWIKWYGPYLYLPLYLVYRAEGFITLIVLAVWLFSYWIITVKWRKLRLFTGIMIPIIFTIILSVHLYYFGGIGGLYREGRIVEQKGVGKFFDIKELEEKKGVWGRRSKITRHARGIFMDEDENAIFATFGCTLCRNRLHRYITIVRIDMLNKDVEYFVSANVRRIVCNDYSNSIFVSPWCERLIYELSKHDLSVIRTIPNQVQGLLWEPMDVFKDIFKNRIFVGNGNEQALISYNLNTGKRQKILNFYKLGLVKRIGSVWCILQSKKTGNLYFTVGPGENLFEVDPDSLDVLKHVNLGVGAGTALAVDDDKGVLYYQSGAKDILYEVDIETFKVKRKFKSEFYARRIRLDKKRNCLYVLGFFSGTVFPIDLKTGKRPWKIRVGGKPHGMHLSNDILWINSMAGIFRLDLETIWENAAPKQKEPRIP